MGYKSPIDIMRAQQQMNLENGIFKAVEKVGINVDKEELIKALQYDRNQYDIGFDDGEKSAAEKILKWFRETYDGNMFFINVFFKEQFGVDIKE